MNKIHVYMNKDGRTRAYDEETQRVVSYPRLIMKEKLGRELEQGEDVHHIDGNPTNNEISNLELRHRGEHQREHATKYFDKEVVCPVCGKTFVWTAKRQQSHYSNFSRKRKSECIDLGGFCSKRCAGLYGRNKQLSRI